MWIISITIFYRSIFWERGKLFTLDLGRMKLIVRLIGNRCKPEFKQWWTGRRIWGGLENINRCSNGHLDHPLSLSLILIPQSLNPPHSFCRTDQNSSSANTTPSMSIISWRLCALSFGGLERFSPRPVEALCSQAFSQKNAWASDRGGKRKLAWRRQYEVG